MSNKLVCLEGMLDFSEETRMQHIDIISFSQGQNITINRDCLPLGQSLVNHVSQQMDNAQKVFNQFNLVKLDELNDASLTAETIQCIFNFNSGSGQRFWQVTYSSLIAEGKIMNFTSVYPDEASMQKEVARLKHCVTNFKFHKL